MAASSSQIALTPPAETAEETILLPGQSPQGEYILAVLVKRSYSIQPRKRCVRLEPAAKLVKGDKHYGDPRITPVRFETDLIPYKVATDVVLNGTACAPGGKAVHALTCSLTVGSHRKDLLVLGDRICRFSEYGAPWFDEPVPFVTMPIRYDLAYGGVDIYSDPDMSLPYVRNPLGKGFVVKNTRLSVEGLPLPNIEDPRDTLSPHRLIAGEMADWERQPMPQGFGWYSKTWYPRAPLAGIMPADRPFEEKIWQAYHQLVPPEQRELHSKTRLPDIDFRYFNGASPELAVPYLQGNEPISLENLRPDGPLLFGLPGERPKIVLDIGFGPKELPPFLHTVMIRSDDMAVDLTWRGHTTYPGPDWLPLMKKLEIHIC